MIDKNITAEQVEDLRQQKLREGRGAIESSASEMQIERHAQAVFQRMQDKALLPDGEIKRRVEEMERERKSEKTAAARRDWNAPKRALKLEKPERVGPWAETLARLEAKLGSGFMIGLIGGRGPGKTQMGVELMRTNTANCKTAKYVTATEFFMTVKQTYKNSSDQSEFDVIANFRAPSLLIIDETGKRSETEWENRLLFELLDKRYQDVVDTLLISNEDNSKFIEAVGPSIASRMNETGGIIQCNWPSFRQ